MWGLFPATSCNPSDGGPVSLYFVREGSWTLDGRTPTVVTVVGVREGRRPCVVSTYPEVIQTPGRVGLRQELGLPFESDGLW